MEPLWKSRSAVKCHCGVQTFRWDSHLTRWKAVGPMPGRPIGKARALQMCAEVHNDGTIQILTLLQVLCSWHWGY